MGVTPLVGAGGYCDDLAGASSAAGHGESIARVGYVVGLMQSGCDPQEATERPVTYIHNRTVAIARAITLSNKGQIDIHFNSKRMAWAYVKTKKFLTE